MALRCGHSGVAGRKSVTADMVKNFIMGGPDNLSIGVPNTRGSP